MKVLQKAIGVFFIFFLLNCTIFAFGKKDSAEANETQESAPQKVEVKKEFLKIDLSLDTKNPSAKNHLNWQNTSAKYKDYFDTISGASKVHSTKNLREFTFDKTAKAFQIPKGLYCLCLFAVAKSDYLTQDGFQITQDGKTLVITFSHRGYEYKIQSDENGTFIVPDSFSILKPQKTEPTEAESAPPASENPQEAAESAKSEENKGETQENAAPEEDSAPQFTVDRAEKSLATIYKGKLKAHLSAEGIFTLKGTLKLAENAEPEPEPPQSEESAEENAEAAPTASETEPESPQETQNSEEAAR